ncbi:hypothetical protein ABT274_12450 [Streptomyces sp. NPDC001127]|uniref:hypothetical protein n=1 Tax=Streptomyces sp. NPDC001127 TaxID=3154377 RepID=UPI00332C0D32
MDETQNAPEPALDEAGAAAVEQSPTADPAIELEKWKALSDENEKRWKAASKQLEELRAERMTDQEKALVQARADARQEALTELSATLTEAEIRAQAATAGVSVQTEYLDLTRFLGDDGRPDAERVAAYVAGQSATTAQPKFPQLMGAGHHRGGSNRVTSMDPTELANLIAGTSFI